MQKIRYFACFLPSKVIQFICQINMFTFEDYPDFIPGFLLAKSQDGSQNGPCDDCEWYQQDPGVIPDRFSFVSLCHAFPY